MTLLMSGGLTIGVSAIVFLLITLILVGLLLFAKAKLVPSGNVSLKVNGEKDIETPIGGTLLAVASSCLPLVVVVVNAVSAVLKLLMAVARSYLLRKVSSLVNK